MADLENGLQPREMYNSTPINAQCVTAMLKGRPGTYCLKSGDAQAGPLTNLYEGERPARYNPMRKQGVSRRSRSISLASILPPITTAVVCAHRYALCVYALFRPSAVCILSWVVPGHHSRDRR